jgi:hypothetical protein
MGRWVGRSNPNRQWWQGPKPSSRGASGGLGLCSSSSSKGYGMGDVGGLSICLFCNVYGVRGAVSCVIPTCTSSMLGTYQHRTVLVTRHFRRTSRGSIERYS